MLWINDILVIVPDNEISHCSVAVFNRIILQRSVTALLCRFKLEAKLYIVLFTPNINFEFIFTNINACLDRIREKVYRLSGRSRQF